MSYIVETLFKWLYIVYLYVYINLHRMYMLQWTLNLGQGARQGRRIRDFGIPYACLGSSRTRIDHGLCITYWFSHDSVVVVSIHLSPSPSHSLPLTHSLSLFRLTN